MPVPDPSAARAGSVFSDNPNYIGAWVCYINGREVPILGWQVDYGIWEVPSCTLQMFPEKVLERLGHEDRVQVALFYLDQWAGAPEMRLIFDGEVIGWSYSNTGSQRTINLSCLAHVHIFQQLYFFFMNTVDDIVSANDPAVRANALTSAGFAYPYNLFHTGLIGAPTSTGGNGQPAGAAEPIKRPFDFVYNVVAGLISDQVPPERRTAPMINFFARWVRHTRFQNRWAALPILDDPEVVDRGAGAFPIFRAARASEALDALQNHAAQRMGNAGPVWNTLYNTLSTVFMEIGMIPTMPCVHVDPLTGVISHELRTSDPLTNQHEFVASTDTNPDQPAFLNFNSETGTNPTPGATAPEQLGTDPTSPPRVIQYVVKPQFLFGTPPQCNVFYPPMIESWTYDENYIQQPTRVYVNDSLMTAALRANGPNANLVVQALSVGWPPEADAVMRQTRGVDSNGARATDAAQVNTGKDILIPFEELYKGPVVDRMQLPQWFQMLLQMRNSTNAGGGSGENPGETVPGATPADATNAPQTDTPETGVRDLSAPPSLEEQHRYIALPREINGRLVLTIHGERNQRFALTHGGGLDPARYAGNNGGVFWGSIWPPEDMGNNRTSTRTTRPSSVARQAVVNADGDETEITPPRPHTSNPAFDRRARRMARFMAAIRPFLQEEPVIQEAALGDDALNMVAFGMAYLCYSETGLVQARNWNFGNFAHSRGDRNPLDWTVIFTAGHWQAFHAFPSADAGLRFFVHRLVDPASPYLAPLRVMLGQIPITRINRDLSGVVANIPQEHRDYFESFGIRPDLYNIALARIGYSEGNGPTLLDNARSKQRFCLSAMRYAQIAMGYVGDGLQPVISTHRDTTVPPLYAPENARLVVANTSNGLRVRPSDATTGATVQVSTQPAGTATPRPATTPPQPPQSLAAHREDSPSFLDVNRAVNAAPATPATTTTQRASGSRTTQNGNVRTQTQTIAPNNENDNRQFADLFRNYAQYEYFRTRYDKRRGAISMAFNPYPVPGFPAVIFDKMTTEHHAVGYVMRVSHVASAASPNSGTIKTVVQLQFCRTMSEFIFNIAQDAERFGSAPASAPAEVIDEIRTTIQDQTNADRFYRRLFYGDVEPRHGASFNFLNALGYARPEGPERLVLEGSSVSDEVTLRNRLRDQVQELDGAESDTPTTPAPATELVVRHNLDPNERLVPIAPYAAAFDSYDAAMKLAARPICTLAQYIRFWHGGRTIPELERAHLIKRGENDWSYQGTTEQQIEQVSVEAGTATLDHGSSRRATAQYWEYIYRLRTGPGAPPSDEALHYNFSTATGITQFQATAGQAASLPADYPETRADWETALEYYRNVVRNRQPPQQ